MGLREAGTLRTASAAAFLAWTVMAALGRIGLSGRLIRTK
jgi:hypothetical protein